MTGNEFDAIVAVPWPKLLWLLLAGCMLGLLFFGSLWLSTGKILHSKRPVLWMLGSSVLRLAVVLPAFYWLSGAQSQSGAQWQRLLALLAGFIIARALVLRVTTTLFPAGLSASAGPEQKEKQHAS